MFFRAERALKSIASRCPDFGNMSLEETRFEADPILAMLHPYPEARWMYFVSRPRCEKKLAERLAAQSIPVYLPMLERVTEYSHRVYRRQLPMFTGYVFAATAPQGFDMRLVDASLLKVNFLSPPLAELLMNDLRSVRKFELLSAEHKLEVKPEIVPGMAVEIRRGVFKGESAVVKRRKNTETVIVNLRSLNMALELELPIDWCEAENE